MVTVQDKQHINFFFGKGGDGVDNSPSIFRASTSLPKRA